MSITIGPDRPDAWLVESSDPRCSFGDDQYDGLVFGNEQDATDARDDAIDRLCDFHGEARELADNAVAVVPLYRRPSEERKP